MQTPSRLEAFWLLACCGRFWLRPALAHRQLGKLAFGNKRHRFVKEEPFALRSDGDDVTLQIGDETLSWEDIFTRESDELVLECASASITGRRLSFDFATTG